MAKNKKSQTIEKVEPVMETISYSGEVTVKLLKGKKVIKSEKIKNNCTTLLLKSIALFLENTIDTNLLPKYMGLGTGTGDWTITTLKLLNEISGSRVPLIRHSIEDLNDNSKALIGYKAPFSATFPADIVSGVNIKEIGLFSGSFGEDNLLARIPVDISVGDQGLSLVIEWVISIKNKDATTTSASSSN